MLVSGSARHARETTSTWPGNRNGDRTVAVPRSWGRMACAKFSTVCPSMVENRNPQSISAHSQANSSPPTLATSSERLAESRRAFQILLQSSDPFIQPLMAAREAPTKITFAFRAKCDAWSEAKPGFGHELPGKSEAIAHPFNLKERIHGAACWRTRVDTWDRCQSRCQVIPRVLKTLDRSGNVLLPVGQSVYGCPLDKSRRAGAAEFDQLAEIREYRLWDDCPTDTPTGH